MTTLVAASDADFGWMLGEARTTGTGGLTLAEGGLEAPEVLAMLRTLAAKVRASDGFAAWMIVAEGEVVGLISYMAAPENAAAVEIGFGIAERRRGRGFARHAHGRRRRRTDRVAPAPGVTRNQLRRDPLIFRRSHQLIRGRAVAQQIPN